jgi:hypothetical protein
LVPFSPDSAVFGAQRDEFDPFSPDSAAFGAQRDELVPFRSDSAAFGAQRDEFDPFSPDSAGGAGGWSRQIRFTRLGFSQSVALLALALATLVFVGCVGAPDSVSFVDGGPGVDGAGDGGPRLQLLADRPFGPEGELPTFLLSTGADDLLLVTPRAIYRLDPEGRVESREPLPEASGGATATVTSAAWDGQGLGATLRWGDDTGTPAGVYLALTDGRGAFSPSAMVALGPPKIAARAVWDTATSRHLVLTAEGRDKLLELSLTRVSRSAGVQSKVILLGGLSSSTTVGDWVGPGSRLALCTVEPPGRALLRTMFQEVGPLAVDLTDEGRRALASCRVAASGRSFLVTWVEEALPVTELDAGPAGPAADLGPGSLSFDVPVARVVGPQGKVLPRSLRLSDYPGTAVVESAVWDGNRYLVLVRTAYRGGRLELSALDEAGRLLFRQRELPLAYEPGSLLGARLVVAPEGYVVVYSIRRPHDEGGVLHLARFTVD